MQAATTRHRPVSLEPDALYARSASVLWRCRCATQALPSSRHRHRL